MRLKSDLARHMDASGFSDVELAAHCRMDPGHLNRLKNGQVRPLLSTAFRISGALGVPVGEIFRLNSDPSDASDASAASDVSAASNPRAPLRAIRGARASRAYGRYRAAMRR